MSCPKCRGTHCRVELDDNMQQVKTCLDCSTSYLDEPERESAPVVDDTQGVAPVVTLPATVQEPSPKAALPPVGVIALARAELKALNAEIARLEKLKKQRDELRRLLDASKQPRARRAAVVRQLRAQGE